MRVQFALSLLAALCVAAGAAVAQTAAETVQTTPSTEQVTQSWTSQITAFADAGGPVIWVLGAVSVFGLAIILVKAAQFTLLRVGDHRFV